MDPTTQRLMMGSRQLKTTLFDTAGTYSWTAPAGTSSVLRLTGRGGSGNTVTEFQGPAGPNTNEASFYLISSFRVASSDPFNSYPTLVGSAITYENMRSRINTSPNLLSPWQSITTNSAGSNYVISFEDYLYRSDLGNWYRGTNNYSNKFRRIGTVSAVGSGSYFGNPDVMNGTGNISTVDASAGFSTLGAYVSNVEVEVTYDNTGGSSTALGFTFAGTSNTNPTQTIQTNVSVTPGTTYSIVVGSNFATATSFIKLEYY